MCAMGTAEHRAPHRSRACPGCLLGKGVHAWLGEPGRDGRMCCAGQRRVAWRPCGRLQERRRPLLLRLRWPRQGRSRGRRHRLGEAAVVLGGPQRGPVERAPQGDRGSLPEDRRRHLPGARGASRVCRVDRRRCGDGPSQASAPRRQCWRLARSDRPVQPLGLCASLERHTADFGSQARHSGGEGTHRIKRRRCWPVAGLQRCRCRPHEGLGPPSARQTRTRGLSKLGRRRSPSTRSHRRARGHSTPTAAAGQVHVDSH
mmetsp:Transcript_132292/g.382464  ORF Transcript_132292/g.382464 Transcript_132292/m.382464 type:complete len:259 (-) Transcript_132292:261-1037(-)